MASLHACNLRLAANGQSDQSGASVSRMRSTRNEAGCFQRVHEIGDIAWRTPQRLAELALRRARLAEQVPQNLRANAGQAPFGEPGVHATSQQHAEFEETLEQLAGVRQCCRSCPIV